MDFNIQFIYDSRRDTGNSALENQVHNDNLLRHAAIRMLNQRGIVLYDRRRIDQEITQAQLVSVLMQQQGYDNRYLIAIQLEDTPHLYVMRGYDDQDQRVVRSEDVAIRAQGEQYRHYGPEIVLPPDLNLGVDSSSGKVVLGVGMKLSRSRDVWETRDGCYYHVLAALKYDSQNFLTHYGSCDPLLPSHDESQLVFLTPSPDGKYDIVRSIASYTSNFYAGRLNKIAVFDNVQSYRDIPLGAIYLFYGPKKCVVHVPHFSRNDLSTYKGQILSIAKKVSDKDLDKKIYRILYHNASYEGWYRLPTIFDFSHTS
jgi:hypothetical protein